MSLYAPYPCRRCGWKYKGKFHICLDRSDPSIRRVHDVKSPKRRRASNGRASDETRAKMSQAQLDRQHRLFLEKHRDVIPEYIRLWTEEGLGASHIAGKMGTDVTATTRILKRLGDMGKIEYQPGRRTERTKDQANQIFFDRHPERNAEIVRLWNEENLGVYQIGTRLGIETTHLRRMLIRFGELGKIDYQPGRRKKVSNARS